ncbi:MAG: DUF421 domain-containing protein, partial [Candidatus Halalkalibacterium sp. M3_1C_030]
VLISTLGIYTILILLTRISGVRTFSKISSFDFAVTVAIGSLIASTILSKDPPLVQAIVALAALFLIQMGIARLRESEFIQLLVDNKPVLLMKGTTIIEENMKKAKVTRSDLLAKLREANVTQMDQIKAVIMESTGDISVLHHGDVDHQIDSVLLDDVDVE